MHIELRVPSTANTLLLARTYDPDLDDIRSILTDVCRAIERDGQFIVSGFGQRRWPLDVGTDLVVFLEQLPAVLRAVKSSMTAEIDFYEQGIERKIVLSPNGDSYLASCVSQTVWQPDPVVEKIDRRSLERMLDDVRNNFMSLVSGISPELTKHEWVRSWLAGSQRMDSSSRNIG